MHKHRDDTTKWSKSERERQISHDTTYVVVESLSRVWSMNCSPPGSSVHGISQTRILAWIAISFSKESSQPRDRTRIFCIDRRILYHWATREALLIHGHVESKIGHKWVHLWNRNSFMDWEQNGGCQGGGDWGRDGVARLVLADVSFSI